MIIHGNFFLPYLLRIELRYVKECFKSIFEILFIKMSSGCLSMDYIMPCSLLYA